MDKGPAQSTKRWRWQPLPSVAKSTIGSLGAGGAGQAALVVSGILAARALGPENRGHLALLTLVPWVVCQLGLLGVPNAVTYYVARDHRAAPAIMRTTLV